MNDLTPREYSVLRTFLLKVINNSADSLEEVDVKAASDVLNKLTNHSHHDNI